MLPIKKYVCFAYPLLHKRQSFNLALCFFYEKLKDLSNHQILDLCSIKQHSIIHLEEFLQALCALKKIRQHT